MQPSSPFRALTALLLTLALLLGARTSSAVASDGAPPDAPAARGAGEQLPRLPAIPRGFNQLERGWITFAYPAGERGRVEQLVKQAGGFREQLSERLGRPVLADASRPRVHVRVGRTPGEMATLAPTGAPFPSYAAGVAYSRVEDPKGAEPTTLVLLTLTPVHPNGVHDLGEVFRHELAHVALSDAVRGQLVPLWFNEGFAIHMSGESSLTRSTTLMQSALAGDLIPLKHLSGRFPKRADRVDLAYAQSADVVRHLVRQQDRARFARMIGQLARGRGFDSAVDEAYGLSLAELELEWREDVAKRYSFWPVLMSGTVIWMGVLVLVVWGWRKRRARAKQTMERWAREEAEEDARRLAAERALREGRLRIVLANDDEDGPSAISTPIQLPPPAEVPKVEHDGEWYTLH